MELLSLNSVSIGYGGNHGKSGENLAVKKASFSIQKGEIFGLMGESGSGKTTIGRAIMRMIDTVEGDITYKGMKINHKLSTDTRRTLCHEMQMIFQDPMASLNERAKVSDIIGEGLFATNQALSNSERESLIDKIMLEVGLRPEYKNRYPTEFSGGQRQRIGIARALIMEPQFIVADEPISALDVSVRAQILNLMKRLQETRGLTYLFISHDMSVMRYFTDRIAVLYHGRIVEIAPTNRLFTTPYHTYTKMLISSIPKPDPLRRVIMERRGELNDNQSEMKPSSRNINFDVISNKYKGREVDIISGKHSESKFVNVLSKDEWKEFNIISSKYKERDAQRMVERAPGHYVLEAY
ncbi:ATP-binding cassette domain-containing protein [Lachnoclostridium phytofermentans]|uniref:ABC transporter related n=1 Tax=Lachnoclostridium phytofermentans (strain ATCC 700394 / DSM 18823 / ISDg) TaxID=357809 RepID=A9KQY1_LACP7|nr:ABC transporter ATP-binding protein [Lachnoclostridium phytofermentans]ABX43460.1 ABC transporter related [Lachnoclostridium phytofermentans ISDg]